MDKSELDKYSEEQKATLVAEPSKNTKRQPIEEEEKVPGESSSEAVGQQ